MALLTKADFCTHLGWVKENSRGLIRPETNKLSVQISRRKVFVDANDMIDTDHPTNVAFIARTTGITPRVTNNKPKSDIEETAKVKTPKSKTPKSDTPKQETPKQESNDDLQLDEDGLMPLDKSDKHYNHWRAIKTENAATLDLVKIEKEKGSLIPTELVIPLFQAHSQQILVALANMTEDALRILCKKYDISVEDRAWIKGNWREIINKTLDNAKEGTKKSLKSLLEQ